MVRVCSARATDEYEAARRKVAEFINSPSDRDVVFTRNASEAINLVANSWGLTNLKEGDEVNTRLSMNSKLASGYVELISPVLIIVTCNVTCVCVDYI